jgi:outer membrane protein insertion porin family
MKVRVALALVGMLPFAHVRAVGTKPTDAFPKPAELKITGYGFLGNRELKRILKTVELGGRSPSVFGPPIVEDAALILSSRVKRDGYLMPVIDIQMELEHGGHMHIQADELLENPLPRTLRITKIHFRIRKGVLYHYRQLRFEGLETVREKQARSYFIETGSLIHLRSTRVYTPEKLNHGVNSLTEILQRAGYEHVSVSATNLIQNKKSGAVDVTILVKQGPKSIVHSVRENFFYDQSTNASEVKVVFPNRPYSRVWQQDFSQALKTNQFRHGYPDTTVEMRVDSATSTNNRTAVDLEAKIITGPKIHLGDVSFEGEKKTRDSILQRRVRIQEGGLLDRMQVEEGRYRLAQLGIFDTVNLNYETAGENTRNVIYQVKEGKTLDFSLLFGYGSYELLRGGFELEQFNIWGLAHHARLKAVQSFKATSGEFTYTMPELVGKDVDVFLDATALRREEVSFTREEYGGGFGVHRYFKPISTDLSLRYNYQILRAADASVTAPTEGLTNSTVGSVILDLKHDRRDNPLYPRKGYKVFGTLEIASEYLAGDVNYQRFEFWNSWHHPLGGGRLLSLGVSHGAVLSIGSTAENLPFNKRFFPGGESSIRGYPEGEASPRDALGKIVGAESYALGTVEFEQSLTTHFSLVLFSDSLGFAQRVSNYPFDTGLFSVGGGLRWKTIIGPIRLEYGYNLNPRPKDPSGALQFSLGFPF